MIKRHTTLLTIINLNLMLLAIFFWATHVRASNIEGGNPLESSDFLEGAPQGLGNPENMWTWSMTWWNGYLYVGTSRNFDCADTLAQARNSFGIITYPPSTPDLTCPEDPLEINMRAEIWRWHPQTNQWERVHQSGEQLVTYYKGLGGSILDPEIITVPITPTVVATDLGYRGMVVFEEPDGTEALYVTAISSLFVGYEVGSPHILRSTDGVNFAPVPHDPGTVLGDYDQTSMRNPIVHVGTDGVSRLYVQGGSSRGPGVVLEAANPAGGNNNFRIVTPEELKISAMESFNGHLYLGVHNRTSGFSILKMDADGGELPYDSVELLTDGGFLDPALGPNREVLTFEPFEGSLYVGGNGYKFSLDSNLIAAELFRLHPDDSWDVIVGLPRDNTPDGPKIPLSGYGPGFDNELNAHMWRISTLDGYLYISTLDNHFSLKDENPTPEQIAEMGFDLWRTGDGVTYESVTTDGFADQIIDPTFPRPDLHLGAFDTGGRSHAVTPYGFFLGTVNPFRGLRVWHAQVPPVAVEISGDSEGVVNTPFEFVATVSPMEATLPLTYTWESAGQPTVVVTGLLTSTAVWEWDSAGLKTVMVTGTNAVGVQVSDSYVIDVAEAVAGTPPTSVAISGISDGLFYTDYTFTAQVSPLTATQPITYSWTATGQEPIIHVGGAKDSVSFNWDTGGSKTVSVTATNSAGTISSLSNINIAACSPIEDVQLLQLPMGELYDNQTIFLQAKAGSGTIPYTYQWSLDGQPDSGNLSFFALSNPTAGIHQIDLTLSNDCSTVTLSRSLLIHTSLANQTDLSLSTAVVQPAQAGSGETLTYQITLRNISTTPFNTTLRNPFPEHTTYIPGSATANYGDLDAFSDENALVWSGYIYSGAPAIITFQVILNNDPLTPGTPIYNHSYLASSFGGNDLVLTAETTYHPNFSLQVNEGVLWTNSPTTTLHYQWDTSTEISLVKFSNDANFSPSPEGNSSPWLTVNPSDPTYSWVINTNEPFSIPRAVYAKFRDDTGRQSEPALATLIGYDPDVPFISDISIEDETVLDQSLVSAIVNVTAIDNASGVAEVHFSNDPNFADYVAFPAEGISTVVSWEINPTGLFYVRVQDYAGNLSEIVQGQIVPLAGVNLTGPTIGIPNTLYTFVGSVLPISTTLPITYTWQATGQPTIVEVGGLEESNSYNWLTSGTKTVQLTVENALGSATVSHIIDIQVPNMVVNPTSINETVVSGQSTNSTFNIANNGEAALNWTLTEVPPTAWVSANVTSGNIPPNGDQDIILTLDAGTLPYGLYTMSLRIQNNDPDIPLFNIPLTLEVLPSGPKLGVTPTELTVTIIEGTSQTELLTIQNNGDLDLTWNLSENPAVVWLTPNLLNGTIIPNSQQQVELTFNAQTLEAGSYTSSLELTSNDPEAGTVVIPITLNVLLAPGILSVSPTNIEETIGLGETSSEEIIITNVGGQTLSWTLSENPTVSWLQATPTNSDLAPQESDTVLLTFNTVGLAVGSYTTTLTIVNSTFNDDTHQISVTMVVVASNQNTIYLPIMVRQQ